MSTTENTARSDDNGLSDLSPEEIRKLSAGSNRPRYNGTGTIAAQMARLRIPKTHKPGAAGVHYREG